LSLGDILVVSVRNRSIACREDVPLPVRAPVRWGELLTSRLSGAHLLNTTHRFGKPGLVLAETVLAEMVLESPALTANENPKPYRWTKTS
jgi:hypothetical protein